MKTGLTPAHYFEAALDVIAGDGVEAVTIARLCERLGVTIGSFYHHFKGSTQFLQAFYGWWEAEHAFRLADRARQEPDPVARLALLKRLSAGLPHRAEAAIRCWSRSHPDAAAAQARVAAAAKLLRYGADCYAYGLLALGCIDIVIEASLKPYDFCAMVPVVAGAGGVASDWRGRALTLASDGRVLVAGDKRAHQQALALLAG